ncbi:galactosylgalactosylxylosylprotein 3-beta-glucuronosyltransferase I-like [Culicoides brevitarsis]|uniref:galactosylgalactosylxylosylprotein 3-beta-glucuronosyltransferase I-like n=1 Tax=Culicoides brevitarsis TaxID=469753 RepID=UPI00307B5914
MILKIRYLILFLIFIGFGLFFRFSIFCEDSKEEISTEDLPTIYAITPTYYRLTQKADLTRLSYCLQLVPNVFWVLIEDAKSTSELVRGILNRGGLSDRSVQLFAKTPQSMIPQKNQSRISKPRGVLQRNVGLDFVIRRMAEKGGRSIVYFMDDDNTYSRELFHEMAKIEEGRVGVWPVGLVGGLRVEKPIVAPNGTITGFNAMWNPGRVFPIDMAAFAISGDLLLKNPKARFHYKPNLETIFLQQITTRDALQPLANLCKEILVWHTRTEKPNLEQENKHVKNYRILSDDGMEL